MVSSSMEDNEIQWKDSALDFAINKITKGDHCVQGGIHICGLKSIKKCVIVLQH